MTLSPIMMLYWNMQIDTCCMFSDFVQWLWRHIKVSRSKTHHFCMIYLFLNKINMNREMGAKWSNQRLEQKNMDRIPSDIRDQRFGIPFHQIWKLHHALINLRICYCNSMGKYALVVSAHCVNINIYGLRTLMLPWQFYRMLEYQVNDLKHILLILLVILLLYVYSRPLEERQVWWLADIFRDSYRVWKHPVSQPIMMKNQTYFMYLLHLYVPYFTHHPHLSSSLLSLNSFVANVICWYVCDLKKIFFFLSYLYLYNTLMQPGMLVLACGCNCGFPWRYTITWIWRPRNKLLEIQKKIQKS